MNKNVNEYCFHIKESSLTLTGEIKFLRDVLYFERVRYFAKKILHDFKLIFYNSVDEATKTTI